MGGVTLSCAAFFASDLGSDVPEVLLVMAGAVPAAAGVGGLSVGWMHLRLRRAADTSGVLPRPPDGKQCVRASVSGDVPYSVAGFDHLVVGDGRPAATPDPLGRFARRPLPETIVTERVRAFRPTDPAGWTQLYKYDGVVLECRDEDRPVLIVTRRRDAPVVLGALLAGASV